MSDARYDGAEFEQVASEPYDETDLSLRAYLVQIPREKLAEYRPEWSDEQVIEWDGNFRSDGNLMLVCCERDVDVAEFRRVLSEFLDWKRAKSSGTSLLS
jgi:hypothetical protein